MHILNRTHVNSNTISIIIIVVVVVQAELIDDIAVQA